MRSWSRPWVGSVAPVSPAAGPAVRVRVPAKVNLHLGVGGVRADRFHELITLFHAVDLVDVISARPADGLSVSTRGSDADAVPDGPGNLAWQAVTALARHAGRDPHVALTIDKAIPVAGGMAGGSADAAAALLACATLWGVPPAELPPLAGALGSDVAFGLLGGTAVGTGRGEILAPVPAPRELHWAFAVAGFGIASAAAYRELDRLREAGAAPPPGEAPDVLVDALARGDLSMIAATLHNDLQPACLALAPALQATLDAGERAGAVAALVSGSGPTCAFLAVDATHARAIAEQLRPHCRAAVVARGPVPGASVL